MYNPLDQFDFSKFLNRMRELDLVDMLKEADKELYRVSQPQKAMGHTSAAAISSQSTAQDYSIKYMDSLRGFHYFFGTTAGTIKPDWMDSDDFALLEPIAKILVSKGQTRARILKFFT